MPSRTIMVGDHVRVPWGLDTLDGVVEDVYETGTSRRVVVRVAVPGSSEDGETVTLPAEVVQLRDEAAEDTFLGEWVTGSRYERRVGEALQRVAPLLPGEEAKVEPRPRIGPDREADFAIEVGPRLVLIEVKSGRPERKLSASDAYPFLQTVRTLLAEAPSEVAGGLLVTDLDLMSSLVRLLREIPLVRAVRWRSPRDDDRIAAALSSLLGGNKAQPPP